ncbi:hypothetical protein BKA64DRAFT_708901 [Cadophora sp. MPI-SDFR-AT-0126]|nr:hypothetical protein BKA64DRAFT_708901 [Leotiomycetes sp. MPI-SDFR-AT-0126]
MSSLPPSHFLSATSASTTSNSHSPKRKRGLPAISTIPPTPPRSSPAPDYEPSSSADMRLSTSIPGVTIVSHKSKSDNKKQEEGEQGSGSPRTKVAYNFQGLRLEDAGAVARFELDGPRPRKGNGFGGDGAFDDDVVMDGHGNADREENQQVSRKKVKVVRQKKRVEVPETPQHAGAGAAAGVGRRRDEEGKFGIVIGEERIVDPALEKAARGVVLSNSVDEMVFTGSGKASRGLGASSGNGSLRGTYPSINRLAESKSRKKRAGTPPLMSSFSSEDMEADPEIDNERALTWHDDEITGHNPTDPDDDGEGINGIGFRPTPAEAYARTQKRRQQMAEYKNREAREARKMRSERRRGSEMSKASKEEQETARRVRFLEGEAGPKTAVSTS